MPRQSDKRPKIRPKVCRYFDKREALRQEDTPDARKRAKEMLTHWSGRHVPKDTVGYYTKRGKHPLRGTYNHASKGMAHARISMTLAKPTANGGKHKPHAKCAANLSRYR